jgi:hypothetical protein
LSGGLKRGVGVKRDALFPLPFKGRAGVGMVLLA